MPVFAGIDELSCPYAFNHFVRPMIHSAAEEKVINKLAGCLVVLKPGIPYEPKYRNAIDDGSFDDLVLWQYHFGDEAEYDIVKYINIARAKAFASYLTGLPSHQVQQVMPALYLTGMTKWGGSAVSGIGPVRLIVAFSGVEWYYDQMISEMMISALQAVCHDQMETVMASSEAMVTTSKS